MSTTLTIAVHEFKPMYGRRMFQIITAGLPIVAVVGLLIVWAVQNLGGDEGEADKAGYVDGTGLLSGHRAQRGFEFEEYPSEDDSMKALLGEDVKRLYVVPADYLKTGVVKRFEIGLGLNLDSDSDSVLQGFLLDNLTDAAPESDVIERLKDPLRLISVALDSTGAPRELNGPRIFFFLGLAFLLMFSLAFTGGFLLQGLGEEKENRIMEVLLSSVTPSQFMAGKVLGLGFAGLSQLLIWVTSGRIILEFVPSVFKDTDFTLPGLAPTLLALVFFILGYLLYATLNAGLGAISPTAREAQQLTIIVAAPLIIPIYGWIYIVENPTAPIVKFLTFLPFTAPLVVLERMGTEAIEAWEVVLSLVLLALCVAGALFLVGRIFRAFLLSYGKSPGLRTLWSALARG